MTPKPQRRNPTNAEVLKEVRELRRVVEPLIEDVASLKEVERDRKVAKLAVEEYLKEHPLPSGVQENKVDQWLTRRLLKMLGAAIGVIVVLAEVIAQLHGIAIK